MNENLGLLDESMRAKMGEQTIETALLNTALVADCAVLSRQSRLHGAKFVAYVVPAGPFVPERLRSYLESVLPGRQSLPSHYVQMHALPRDAFGKIDKAALAHDLTIDINLIDACEHRLRSMPEVEDAAVMAQERAERLPPVHLSDLLPELKQTPSECESAAGSQSAASESRELDGAGSAQTKPAAMALSDGGKLEIPPDAPKTLSEALIRTATRYKDKGIVYVQPNGSEDFQTYAELLQEAKSILAGLYESGLKPHDKVVLQIDVLRDHFTAFWACVLGGITPVTVAVPPTYQEAGGVVNKLFNIWKLLGQPAILAGNHMVQAISGLDKILPMPGLRILPVGDLKKFAPAERIYQSEPTGLVFFQLTSGSTGVPKCIQETHRGIIAHIHSSRQFNGYTPDDVSLNWLPVDHVVPILTFHLKDVYLGCNQVHIKTDMVLSKPILWLDYMEAHRVTHSWAPNFGFKLLADALKKTKGPERTWDLSSLKFLMNAGEQVTLPVVREFLEVVAPFGVKPQVMQPAFGMAEVCTCMTYLNNFDIESGVHRFAKSSLGGTLKKASSDDAHAAIFVDLGGPTPGVQIRITDQQNRLLPEATVGRLQIKGPVVTPGYYHNEPANREAFVGDDWFNSGDLGFILDGRLTLTGREKEMIIIRGANFYCYEIEDVVNRIEGVEPTFVAACAVADPASGTEGLAVFFVIKGGDAAETETGTRVELLKTIKARTTAEMGITPAFVIPLPRKEFPKTTSGKIQRGQLKKALEAGAFKEQIKKIEIDLETPNTIPDWFFRAVWAPKEAGTSHAQPDLSGCLLFNDRAGLGGYLFSELARRGYGCTTVDAGNSFKNPSPGRYVIDPGNPTHYRMLFESIAKDNRKVSQILHLWTYDNISSDPSNLAALEKAQDRGAYSLLYLVQALAQSTGGKNAVRLNVISSHTHAATPMDLIAPEKCTVPGLLKTIPHEMPWLDCRHIDLPVGKPEEIGNHVVTEMFLIRGDREVAYRDGQRLVRRLEKADLAHEPKATLPFKTGGTYLISGGLGGVGVQIAKYLLQNYGANLLLLGRTSLPERTRWDALVKQSGVTADRTKAFLELEQLPGKVQYEAVDICDPIALKSAVGRAMNNWSCEGLDGIIHLAATFEERFLIEETQQSFSAALRPKMIGAAALAQLIENQPAAFFIGFSSVNSLFGGATVGAYAAANSFLDGFLFEREHRRSRPTWCIAWSPWDETGMSRGYQLKAVSRSRGYYSISPRQGVFSLLAALQSRRGDLIVGLDGANANIRQHLALSGNACHAQALSAYVTLKAGQTPDAIQAIPVCDSFGVEGSCIVRRIKLMPRDASGGIDRAKLAASIKGANAEHKAPETELERQIAAVWEEALGVSQASVNDNFFELGGHSLLATQMLFKLQEVCGVELPLRCLFTAPTISGLAGAVAERRGGNEEKKNAPESLARIVPAPETTFEPFPLTDIQQAYWIGRTGTYALGNVGCHVYTEIDFEHLDTGRFYQALQALIQRHGMLRAVMLPDGRQRILPRIDDYKLKTLVVRGADSDSAEAQLRSVRESMSHQVLPAQHAPLFEIRVTQMDRGTRLHCSFDLLVADARSFQILIDELSRLYMNPQKPLPPLELSFRDYVMNESKVRETEKYKRSREYWVDRLAALPPAPDLPMVKNPSNVSHPHFVRRHVELNPENWTRLKAHAKKAGLTPSGVLMAALAEVLGVWSKNPRYTINLTLFNRLPLHPQVNEIVGDFTSSTLLAVERGMEKTFEGRARRMQDQLWQDLDHRDFSGVQVLREMSRASGSAASMPVVFTSVLDLPSSNQPEPSLLKVGKFVYGITQTPQVWLDNQVYEHGGRLLCNWDVVEELFPDGLMDDMFAAYAKLLNGLVRDEQSWQATWSETVQKSLPEEQLKTREAINATQVELIHGLMHSFFVSQAAQKPERPAVINGGKTLNYGELDQISNRIACVLRHAGAKPNTLVAVVLEKGWEQVAAVLGILKSGAAYLPIDPDLPQERLEYLLTHAEVKFALTLDRLDRKFKWPAQVTRYCLDDPRLPAVSAEALEDVQSITDLAYVIYTSGSTGLPKGVAIDHRGAVNTILDINQRFAVKPEDRVLALSALNFDLSVYDIFGLLAAGGTVVIPENSRAKDPAHWAELVQRDKVTIWDSVPALMLLMVQHAEKQGTRLDSLRLAMMSGDWVPVTLPGRIKALIPQVQTISLGGATEASIWSILYPIEEVPSDWKSIPYGRPMLNQTFHVLNETMAPSPVWVPGQLYIGGIGLALGYWRDDEKTAKSFVVHPLTGERLYKTGDLGRYLPDGNIEFLGREDFQVKINGFRIELGEIDCALEQHPSIQSAVAVAATDENGNKRLVAYVVPRQDAKVLESSELRSFLKTKLPDYMVPSTFVIRETLPLTPNGKVDRRAMPTAVASKAESKYVAPRNKVEEVLAGMLAEMLEVDRVGVFDNFFELGGHSLLAIQFISRLRDAFEVEPPASLFETPTVGSLSELMLSDPERRGRIESTAEVLINLSEISEDEVDARFAGQLSGI